LPYEVKIEVKHKITGKVSRMYYPNVGRIQTDHILASDFGEVGEEMMTGGMPQALLMVVGFNASPNTGRGLEVKDGGVPGFGAAQADKTEEDGMDE